ncbi:MAG: helix-turn-helix transcriptional regulator [Nitrospinaceae bacterium]|jgi:DNA-binding XRE family transcriptional regulator|nr:MAG: helix-turn-helix transcriptional regulator [Nitrospinaceae bacterium]
MKSQTKQDPSISRARDGYPVVLLDEQNSVRQIRESMMMSKSELARKANVTVQTIDRIEKGKPCRLDTKRKIILALGFKLGDREKIF